MISDKTIKAKLKIIQILFEGTPYLVDKLGELIDYQFYGADKISYVYLNSSSFLRKKDLIYINKIVKRLTDILSLDESLITKKYIASKLSFQYIHRSVLKTAQFEASDEWIGAYKKLIKYIKNGK